MESCRYMKYFLLQAHVGNNSWYNVSLVLLSIRYEDFYLEGRGGGLIRMLGGWAWCGVELGYTLGQRDSLENVQYMVRNEPLGDLFRVHFNS